MKGILGRKLGMTQVFGEDGILAPVTIIEAGPCDIVQIKNKDRDSYAAVQIGFMDIKKPNKPAKGRFKSTRPKRFLKELRMGEERLEEIKPGQSFGVDIFEAGGFVDVRGVSKGKGFQGGVKRWGWHGGPGGHGSMHHKAPGSIGASSFPSRVLKGKHLPGRMGGKNATVQHLKIMGIDKENNLLLLKGSIPGHDNSLVLIVKSKKKAAKEAKGEGGKDET